MTDTTIAQRLEQLLTAERAALLDGDFDRIGLLIEEKQKLVDELKGKPEMLATLVPLRAGLRRNQELFDQALAGIRNVAARLGDLNRARKSINTYDAQGRKHSIEPTQTRKLERRA